MTDSQAYKQYVRRLATSGLPTCKEQLARLAAMDDSEAFQWFQTHKLQRDLSSKPTSDVDEFLARVLADDAPAEAPAKPVRKAANRKPANKRQAQGDYTFKSGLYRRYGIEPRVGATFRGKRGGTFTVVAVEADCVKCAKS